MRLACAFRPMSQIDHGPEDDSCKSNWLSGPHAALERAGARSFARRDDSSEHALFLPGARVRVPTRCRSIGAMRGSRNLPNVTRPAQSGGAGTLLVAPFRYGRS